MATLKTILDWPNENIDGYGEIGGMWADSAGNLFGLTNYGGFNYDGLAFEIVKTSGGYARSCGRNP